MALLIAGGFAFVSLPVVRASPQNHPCPPYCHGSWFGPGGSTSFWIEWISPSSDRGGVTLSPTGNAQTGQLKADFEPSISVFTEDVDELGFQVSTGPGAFIYSSISIAFDFNVTGVVQALILANCEAGTCYCYGTSFAEMDLNASFTDLTTHSVIRSTYVIPDGASVTESNDCTDTSTISPNNYPVSMNFTTVPYNSQHSYEFSAWVTLWAKVSGQGAASAELGHTDAGVWWQGAYVCC